MSILANKKVVAMKTLETIKDLKLMANAIRMDIVNMLTEAGSGHPAGPLGLAEIFTVLYFREMHYKADGTNGGNDDRLVLSNGHVCPVLYSAMAHAGYFPLEELMTLRKFGSRLQGHPSRVSMPGIANSSGPLGQGLSIACGYALAKRLDRDVGRIYCVTSDGEHDEGNTWEAVLFAAKYKLDNLVQIIDRNYIQIDGRTEDVMPLDPLDEKYRAFGWNAIYIDGHDFEALLKAFEEARKTKGKPTVIIANTVPGKGVSFMERFYEWHGKPPSKEQGMKAIKQLLIEKKKIEEGLL